ncbi:hypothetical protein BDF19DRAFT_468142 [Syncephalis fuscata]|nr:hypothetical protein BDF19DRAFT_468142 [Syncephalis fuscata]
MAQVWMAKGLLVLTLGAVVGIAYAVHEMMTKKEEDMPLNQNRDSSPPADGDEQRRRRHFDQSANNSSGQASTSHNTGQTHSTGINNDNSLRQRGSSNTTTIEPSHTPIIPPPRTSSITSRENELQEEMSYLNVIEQRNEARRLELQQEEEEIERRAAALKQKRLALDQELHWFQSTLPHDNFTESSIDTEPYVQPVTVPDNYENPGLIWAAPDADSSSLYIPPLNPTEDILAPMFPDSPVDSFISSILPDEEIFLDTTSQPIYIDNITVANNIDEHKLNDQPRLAEGHSEQQVAEEEVEEEEEEGHPLLHDTTLESIDALSNHFSEDSWSNIGSE